MPVQPPPPVAPPAAAPSPSAPPPDATDKIKTEYVPALMQKLMLDVSEEEASGDPEISKKKPEDKKPADPNPGDPPAAPKPGDIPPTPEMKVRRNKKERPPLPTVDDAPPPPPPPPPRAAAPAPEVDASKRFEEGLEENEREMLADARFLEEKFGDKYKGMGAKVEKFLRDHIAMTEKPDFDDQDPDYLRWVDANMPKLSRSEIRQIEETRITESLRKDNEKQFSDLHFQGFVKEKAPEIDRIGQQAYNEMTNAALPDELSTLLRDQIAKLGPQKGYEEAMKTHKLEIETAETVLMAAADDIKEFHRLNLKDPKTGRTVSEFIDDPAKDPSANKEKFQQHQRLANMVDGVCENFKNAAGEEAIRDGKWFVTRKEWLRLRPEARGRFWTFTNKEIIDRAKAGIKGVIEATIAQKHEYLKSRGWSRAAASSSAPPAPPPTSTPRGAPPPSPVPGPGGDPGGGPSATAKNLATTLNAG